MYRGVCILRFVCHYYSFRVFMIFKCPALDRDRASETGSVDDVLLAFEFTLYWRMAGDGDSEYEWFVRHNVKLYVLDVTGSRSNDDCD